MVRTPRHARSLDDALARCARHGRGALAEMGAALAAAIDACSFVVFGCAADESALEPFWLLAVELGVVLGAAPDDAEALARAFANALDDEIARWEKRGQDNLEARAVARAFSELRALIREFVAREPPPQHAGRGGRSRRTAAGASHPKRTDDATGDTGTG